MSSAEMEVIIKASVDQAGQNISRFNQTLDKTRVAATNVSNALQNTGRVSSAAGQALVSLGRVVQDAPFGFIAIQNNLNPLLESLQRFQEVSKETGTSLTRNLVGALTGPAGLGLALSAVSFIALKYPDLFSTISKETLKAAEAQKAYVDALAQAGGSLETELTRLSALIQIARDTGESTQTRTNAIKELQKEYPDYLKNLSLETINSQNAQRAIDDLVGSLERKAKAQALSNLITAENEKLIKLQNSSLSDQVDFFDALFAGIKNFGSQSRSTADLVAKASKDRAKAIADEQVIIANYNKQFAELLATQAKGGDFKIKPPNIKDVETVAKILQDLTKQEFKLDVRADVEGVDIIPEKIKAIQEAIERLKGIGVGKDNIILLNLQAQVDDLKLKESFEKLHKQIQDDIQDIKLAPIEIQIPVTVGDPNKITDEFKDDVLDSLDNLQKDIASATKFRIKIPFEIFTDSSAAKKFHDLVKEAESDLDDLNDSIQNVALDTLVEGFADFGKAIGGGQNPFGALFEQLAKGLEALGAALIKYGVIRGIINKLFSTSLTNPAAPFLAIGAGIALEALGALLESKVHLAEGGIVTSPIIGLIGERGREVVMPLDRLHEVFNIENRQQVFIAENRISGQDIITAYKRADKHNKRTY